MAWGFSLLELASVEKVAHALDLVDRAVGRADQDLVKAARLDILDPSAGLVGRADEIDRGELGALRPLLQIDRAIRQHGVGAAGLAIGGHAEFEVIEAAIPPRRRPALRLLGGIGDPARAAPGPDQDRRAALAPRPDRQRPAIDWLLVPHLGHDFE